MESRSNGIAIRNIFPFIGITIFLFLGCAHDSSIKEFLESDLNRIGPDYKSNLDLWTRETRIYKGFDLELMSICTYLSPEFRKAYATEYARVFKLTDEEKKRLGQEQMDIAQKYDEFLIATYSPEKQINDFEKKKSTWRIYLILDENIRLEPEKIEKRKTDAVVRYFFPHASPWKTLYAIRFPRSESRGGASSQVRSSQLKLTITGVRGSTEMIWNLK